MANVDFNSLQKEFVGALPLGFEGVKNLALQKVEKITPLAGIQPFANTQGKLLLWLFVLLIFEQVRAASHHAK